MVRIESNQMQQAIARFTVQVVPQAPLSQPQVLVKRKGRNSPQFDSVGRRQVGSDKIHVPLRNANAVPRAVCDEPSVLGRLRLALNHAFVLKHHHTWRGRGRQRLPQ